MAHYDAHCHAYLIPMYVSNAARLMYWQRLCRHAFFFLAESNAKS